MSDTPHNDLPPWLQDDDSDKNPSANFGDSSASQGNDEGDFKKWLVETGRLVPPKDWDMEAEDEPETEDASEFDEPAANIPDWLAGDTMDFQEATPEESYFSHDEPEEEMPDWLNGSADATPESEVTSYEDWAKHNQLDEEDFAEIKDPAADLGGLSYDEWERQQEEAEKPPEPDVPLPDMPDLFGDMPARGTGSLVGSDDYVPEWFMGVEELDAAQAPDWLQGVGFGTGSLPPQQSQQPPQSRQPDLSSIPLPDDDELFGGDVPLPSFDEVAPTSNEDQFIQPPARSQSDDEDLKPQTADLGSMFLDDIDEESIDTADLGSVFLSDDFGDDDDAPDTADLGSVFLGFDDEDFDDEELGSVFERSDTAGTPAASPSEASSDDDFDALFADLEESGSQYTQAPESEPEPDLNFLEDDTPDTSEVSPSFAGSSNDDFDALFDDLEESGKEYAEPPILDEAEEPEADFDFLADITPDESEVIGGTSAEGDEDDDFMAMFGDAEASSDSSSAPLAMNEVGEPDDDFDFLEENIPDTSEVDDDLFAEADDDFDSIFGNLRADLSEPETSDRPTQTGFSADDRAALFGDSEDFDDDDAFETVEADLDMPEMDFETSIEDMDNIFPPAEEGNAPDWLSGYDRQTAQSEIEPERDFGELEEPEPQLESGELPAWFKQTDFLAMPEPDEPDEESLFPDEEDLSLPQESSMGLGLGTIESDEEEFDLDALFGGDAALVPLATSVDDEPDEILSPDEMAFDDSIFDDLPLSDDDMGGMGEPDEATGEIEPAAIGQDEIPDWMRQVQATGEDFVLQSGGVQGHFDQIPSVVLSPELRDLYEESREFVSQTSGKRGKAVDSGPLAGVEGALDLDNERVVPGALSLDRVYSPTEDQQKRLNALQRVLDVVQEETEAQRIDIRYDLEKGDDDEQIIEELGEPAPAPRTRRRIQWDRLFVTFVLLAVIIAPFLTDVLHVANDIPDELDSNAAPLGLAVDNLAQGETRQPVLFAFEYGPTASHELDPLVEAVLRDVLAHNGRPVIVSTNPMGMLHAQNIMRELGEDEALLSVMGISLTVEEPSKTELFKDFKWGFGADKIRDAIDNERAKAVDTENVGFNSPDEYVLARYIAGGAVGVRALVEAPFTAANIFATDINGEETNLNIERLDDSDFAFVVVAGESYEDTRIWAEQLDGVGIPKFALVTAAAEPMTRPYLSADSYTAMLSGIRGSLMYNKVRNASLMADEDDENGGLPDPFLSSWHAAAWGALLATLIIVVGTVFNMSRAIRTMRKRGQ